MAVSKLCFLEKAAKRQENMDVFCQRFQEAD
jgi:hypothetical protein